MVHVRAAAKSEERADGPTAPSGEDSGRRITRPVKLAGKRWRGLLGMQRIHDGYTAARLVAPVSIEGEPRARWLTGRDLWECDWRPRTSSAEVKSLDVV